MLGLSPAIVGRSFSLAAERFVNAAKSPLEKAAALGQYLQEVILSNEAWAGSKILHVMKIVKAIINHYYTGETARSEWVDWLYSFFWKCGEKLPRDARGYIVLDIAEEIKKAGSPEARRAFYFLCVLAGRLNLTKDRLDDDPDMVECRQAEKAKLHTECWFPFEELTMVVRSLLHSIFPAHHTKARQAMGDLRIKAGNDFRCFCEWYERANASPRMRRLFEEYYFELVGKTPVAAEELLLAERSLSITAFDPLSRSKGLLALARSSLDVWKWVDGECEHAITTARCSNMWPVLAGQYQLSAQELSCSYSFGKGSVYGEANVALTLTIRKSVDQTGQKLFMEMMCRAGRDLKRALDEELGKPACPLKPLEVITYVVVQHIPTATSDVKATGNE